MSLVLLGGSMLVHPGRAGTVGGATGVVLWLGFMGRTFAFHAAIGAVVAGVVAALASRACSWRRLWPLYYKQPRA